MTHMTASFSLDHPEEAGFSETAHVAPVPTICV